MCTLLFNYYGEAFILIRTGILVITWIRFRLTETQLKTELYPIGLGGEDPCGALGERERSVPEWIHPALHGGPGESRWGRQVL